MDPAEIESLAIETYDRHGFDPAEPVSTLRLARRIYGDGVILRDAPLIGRNADTGWLNGAPRISYRRLLPIDEIRFYVGHELFHLLLGRKHNGDPQLEIACDYGSACLMAPRAAILALFRIYGWDVKRIAEELCATQTCAAMRIAEVLRRPLAAISPAKVRVRGPEDFVWPDEPSIRKIAAKGGPGLTKVRITDRPRRLALLADE